MTNPLAELRDVHLPLAPHWWPLSNLAYGVLLVSLIILLIIAYIGVRKWLKGRAKRRALKQIDIYKKEIQQDKVETVASLSILLRRVALAYYPRHKVAGLTGEEWLRFLNESGDTKEFTHELGKLLLTVPYQKYYSDDIKQLLNLVEEWIKKRK